MNHGDVSTCCTRPLERIPSHIRAVSQGSHFAHTLMQHSRPFLIFATACIFSIIVSQAHPLPLQGLPLDNLSTTMQPSLSLGLASQRAWRAYERRLEKAPVATKTMTSVIATILGDALAQHSSKRKVRRYDWARTARLTVFQGLLMGPLGHIYYQNLDARVMPSSARSPVAVASKVVIDQLVFAPICTVAFYLFKVASEGRPGALRQELSDKYLPTMVANWKLWPAAHIINFAFVPPRQRILYANVVSVLGVYILSRAAAGDFGRQRGQQPQQQQVPVERLPSRHLQQQEEGAAAPGEAGLVKTE